MPDPNKKGGGSSRQDFLKTVFAPQPSKPASASKERVTAAAGTPKSPETQQATPRSSSTTQSTAGSLRAPNVGAPVVHPKPPAAVRAELCPHCGAAIDQPQIAIVCQKCNRFVVPLRFWHGAIAVALTLAAAGLQAFTGQPTIAVGIGLAASQLLLVFAVRPFERYFVLIVISFLLVPASLAIVAVPAGFAEALPKFIQVSPVWISVAVFFALMIELFVHWRRAGQQHGLSIWRILGTFSIAASAGALVLLLALSAVPPALTPADGFAWRALQHALRFRAGALLVWLAYVVLISLPAAYARRIDPATTPGWGLLQRSLLHVAALGRGAARNLGLAILDGAKDVALLARGAIAPIGRRILFLASVVAWQVAFSLLIESYLSYLVDRKIHALQLVPATLAAAIAPVGIFWTLARVRLAHVLEVSVRTVTMTGSLLGFCAAVATLFWWAYELFSGRRHDVNWIGTISIVLIAVAVLMGFMPKKGKSAP